MTELPPHDPAAPVDVGDQVVITVGEQRGWTGRVTWRDERSQAFGVAMIRPDGSRGPEVMHREECVAKTGLQVPQFDDVDQAEAWLDERDRDFRPGADVIFTAKPHQAQQLSGGGTEWLTRHFELEFRGKVVRYLEPGWRRVITPVRGPLDRGYREVARPAAYELLVLVDGDPVLIEVETHRVLRRA